jgi:chorismate synthase
MAGNSFGKLLKITSFGESHGPAVGGIIDGFPSGIEINVECIQNELDKRRPGQSEFVTSRNEKDRIEILSGVFNGKTIGTPIGFLIRNKDVQSNDYSHLENTYRPSHADFTYEKKYGIRDHRGGGRSSARETVSRVVAGAFAKIFLNHYAIQVEAYVEQIGNIATSVNYKYQNLKNIESSPLRCPDKETELKMMELIKQRAQDGDSLGGTIFCVIKGVPAGIGEPVFDKLNADLAKAMMSINAVKGFEIGSGFSSVQMKGSEHNDIFINTDKGISTLTNRSGGIQGGISNGEDIYFRVAFKPVATIMSDQKSVDRDGNETLIKGKGRHDVTVVPRAVPIVEAMAALVIADHLLLSSALVNS